MMDEELNKKVLSRMKTNLKISWTKRTNKLNELIKNEANEFAVQSQLDLIDEKLTEANEIHEEFAAVEEDHDKTWLNELNEKALKCQKMVEVYCTERRHKLKEMEVSKMVEPQLPAVENPNTDMKELKISGKKSDAFVANEEINTEMKQLEIKPNGSNTQILKTEDDPSSLHKASHEDVIEGKTSLIYDLIFKEASLTYVDCIHEVLLNTLKKISQSDIARDNTDWFLSLIHKVDSCSLAVSNYKKTVNSKQTDTKAKTTNSIKVKDQIERVKLPEFSGKFEDYFTWKTAFQACIESSSLEAEVKLLHLRQSLKGDALAAIHGLGHSEIAYKKSLEILERKFGGSRRRTALYLEKVDQFTPMKTENAVELERLSDLLNILIVSFEDENRTAELKDGFLYLQLKKKLTQNLLTQYQRWIREKDNPEDIYSLSEFINQESDFRTTASEAIKGLTDTKQRSYQITSTCSLCEEKNHSLDFCEVFKSMSCQERWEIVKQQKRCFRCLRTKHIAKNCKQSKKCNIESCERDHHSLLHNTSKISLSTNQSKFKSKQISLRTLPVLVHFNGKSLKVNAMLDDGSDQTFMRESTAQMLKLIRKNGREISVEVFDGNDIPTFTSDVEFEISNLKDDQRYKVSAMTSKNVVGDYEAVNWNIQKENLKHLAKIPFNPPVNQSNIDILIGTDYPFLHKAVKEVAGSNLCEPLARLTPLGWTCIGKACSKSKVRQMSVHVNKVSMFVPDQKEIEDINTNVKKFWEIEDIQSQEKMMSKDDRVIYEETVESLIKTEDKTRFQVDIPWNQRVKHLTNNYNQALSRLKNTESQLKKKPEIEEVYEKSLKKFLDKGYISRVAKEKVIDTKWFLPHFPVIKPERETTKVRIIFDAAAKCLGTSLNDAINQGPDLQQDLFKILLRFRSNLIALTCDISEMFHQVQIPKKDRKYFRFLWKNNPTSDSPDVYEWNRIIMGGKASPFLAHLVSRKNAESFQEKYPRAVETILSSTYTDDSLDSVETSFEAIKLYEELKCIWKNAGMDAKKWLSNNAEVMKHIPQEDRTMLIDLSENSNLPTTKTLGILWDANTDEFLFKVSAPESVTDSKRKFLKMISTVFDPLGFLSAFTVRAKIIMQSLWIKQLDWDETVDEQTMKEIDTWMQELDYINDIRIPRCLSASERSSIVRELHIFMDASEDAYAAVAYLRVLDTRSENVANVFFVCSKSRVAPIESLSIPRLELLAADLGASMKEKVAPTLKIQDQDIYFWTDSKDVLGWLRNRSRIFKPFVAHRVGNIQRLTLEGKWFFVPSQLNPADLASRGAGVLELKKWFQGPKFLHQERSEWPEQDITNVELKETRAKKIFNINLSCKSTELLHPDDFSSWKRIYRVMAWVLRFVANCSSNKYLKGPLSVDEIEDAKLYLIKRAQTDNFSEEIKQLKNNKPIPKNSYIQILIPRLDEEGVLRASSRLEQANFLHYNTKYPIILPNHHRITELLIKEYHEKGHHQRGTNATLADISTKYWIISGREEIRRWEKKCNTCKKLKAKAASQIMAPLPKKRLQKSLRAFENCAVDYAGPFFTTAGRGKVRYKRYLCLFTCLVTRAVHLEMVYSLDTGSFLNAFWRFCNRRGFPKEVVSDNGSNFVRGEKELQKLVKLIDIEAVINKTSGQGVKWSFNPPYSPHHGGIFESMIKSAKRAMYSQMENTTINDEELITIITGAEALINSRPLSYQSASSKDLIPLTPNHFLFGQLGGQFAPEAQVNKVPLNTRWRRVQNIIGNIWSRWMKELIPIIGKRNKWTAEHKNLEENQVVIVLWPDLPRSKWPLGRIVEAVSSKDGNIRTVKVAVNGKVYTRGLNTIYPLNIEA